jgi:hypothetical protein
MRLHPLMSALTFAALGALVLGPASAETNLVETIWLSQSKKCAIREIRFYDFGHALVRADGIGTDEADWKQDVAMVHVTFDNWNGNLDGPIDDDGTFKAIYTWRSDETLSATSVACDFRRK